MAITKELLENISKQAMNDALKISGESNHANWYPCGYCHLEAKGNSKLANAIRKHRPEGWRMMKATKGVWISVNFPGRDAYEQQSMNFHRPCYENLNKILKANGIDDAFVDGWTD